MLLIAVFCLLCFSPVFLSYQLDPSDFFTGAQHRPRLEIVYPENGQVLDDVDLDIKINLDGYDMPSQFHDSRVCVGLSTGTSFNEHCFDQSPDLEFHVKGLIPGAQYSLRIAFYERGNAIAVSVRSFRVAGIKGLVANNQDEVVTIMTAVQVAVNYQASGMEALAESIYRDILTEYPTYPNALHLLGVLYYQKGDPSSAIPYIERALNGTKSFEAFHNTLGECYRTLGKIADAQEQFQIAVALNPDYLAPVFNLGLTYQQTDQWEEAINQYRKVTLATKDPARGLVVSDQVREESKIRECDLLQAMGRASLAKECWLDGLSLFPGNDLMYNELGNLYGQGGEYDEALDLYRQAAGLGSLINMLDFSRSFMSL
jgi:Tfp pilus assembly protein PilF